MKAIALLAALVVAAPVESFAGRKSFVVVGHSGSNCAPRYYGGHSHGYSGRSYGGTYSSRSYCYTRPSYGYYRPSYYGSSYYGSYGYAPAVSLSYTSVPRTYYRSAPAYESASSLEADVQRTLKRQGYYSGSIDGDIGPASREAIRDYQYERGLQPTGRIDAALLRSLGL